MTNLNVIEKIALLEQLIKQPQTEDAPRVVQTPTGFTFAVKKGSNHPIAQILRKLEQNTDSQEAVAQDSKTPCNCESCKIQTALWDAADKVVEVGMPAILDSNVPDLEGRLKAILSRRNDIEIGRTTHDGSFVIAPAGFSENDTCTCGENCNEHTQEPQQEPQQEQQPKVDTEHKPRTLQEAVEREILAIYPKAKRTDKGVAVGDVVLCHPSADAVLVTPSNIMEFSQQNDFFIVAHVGNM